MWMSQQSVNQAARRSALDALAVPRRQRIDRARRLEALVVAVLPALGERDAQIRELTGMGKRSTMADDLGLSVREAVEWRRMAGQAGPPRRGFA
jgi:hypothetical protein